MIGLQKQIHPFSTKILPSSYQRSPVRCRRTLCRSSLLLDLVVKAFQHVPCTFAVDLLACNNFSCAGTSVEGVSVVINNLAGSNSGSDCSANTGLTALV